MVQRTALSVIVVAAVATAGFLLLLDSGGAEECSQSGYYSKVLNASFCYPESWTLVHGDDAELLPVNERPPGYQAWIRLERPGSPVRPFLATLGVLYTGDLGREVIGPETASTLWNCADPNVLRIDGRLASVCVVEHAGPGQLSQIPESTLRIIGVEIEGDEPIVIGIELFNFDEAAAGVTASRIEAEAMAVITSFREGKRP